MLETPKTTVAATRLLAEFTASLSWEDVPPNVISHAKTCILDAFGCCLFGSTLPWSRILVETIVTQDAKPEASIWGTAHKVTIAHAALANCAAGHSFELDDLHTAGLIHSSTLSAPVAAGFTERDDATGRDFLLACIAGFEVGLRVGIAAGYGLFHRGFHPQGATGVFAAAATAARMLHFNADLTQQTLAIAASMAAGLMAAQEGAMAKRLHAGHAGYAGVFAALLAQRGYTGIANAIEAPYGGFLHAYSDAPAPDLAATELGTRWETLSIGFKAYPTVSCVQGPLRVLRDLMVEHRLRADDIASVHVDCGTFTYRHTVWDFRASGLTEAQMNMFYGLSMMALDGEVFVDQFRDEFLSRPDALAFMKRITVSVDPAIDALGPARRDAVRLTLKTRDSRVLSAERTWRPGSPEDPMSIQEVRTKFRRLTKGRWADAKTEGIIASVDKLEALPSLQPLLADLHL